MRIPEEAIDAYLAEEAKSKGEPATEEGRIEVLAENWDAVRVYVMCIWETRTHLFMTQAGAQSKTEFVGIRMQEMESAARMLNVDTNETLAVRVRTMIDEAKQFLNKDLMT